MKKTVLISVRGAYEPPFAEIIEFAVEGGFELTGNPDVFDNQNGTETPGREYVENPWG